ncbi:MAG: glycerol-3-phosphate acyltransferase [Clostridiales bacterium]|nr:glycerol-3-phosphate acyltransferase [Clostridiales bacterium]
MKTFYLSQNWWQLIVIAIVCYFIGSFNFARAISHTKQKDITQMGSGNPGTMNMTREFGLKIGFLTFICDAFKGGIPAVICFFLYRNYVFADTQTLVSDFMRYFCGLFVVIGHIFPITMKFKGGKGIACTLGLFWFSLACENAWWLLIAFAGLWLVVLYIYLTEWGSMGSLLGVTGFSIVQMVMFVPRYANTMFNAYLVCLYLIILLINILTWTAHKENLLRLFAGEEHHTSLKRLSKKK